MLERRKHPREAVKATVQITPSNGTPFEKEPLSVSNVSPGGLAFRSTDAWPTHASVRVCVNIDHPMELRGKVLWCTEHDRRFKMPWQQEGERYFEVGVEFVEGDDERRQHVMEQILRCDAYHRGLWV